MSSLPPLIVISIAFLHCAQADPTKNCHWGREEYSSTGERNSLLSILRKIDCSTGKCFLGIHRSLPDIGKYTLHFDCKTITTAHDLSRCEKAGLSLSCFCEPTADSLCNSPELLFNENGDEAQKGRFEMASDIGLIAQPRDGQGMVSFNIVDLKCEKWTVAYTVTDDKFEENEVEKKSVVGCPGSLCTTSVVRDPDANTISVKSGCYSGPVRTAIPYKHETSDNSIDVNCWANTKSRCNTLELMFDPEGDWEHLARIADLKAKTGLVVYSSKDSNGIKKVDFKWSNCMKYAYEQPLNGPTVEQVPIAKSVPCKAGVCFATMTRNDQDSKISVMAGCKSDNPNLDPPLCRTFLEDQTTTCRCPAEKEPCNTVSALYKEHPDQKKRLRNLQQIGIHVAFDSTGEGKVKYDEDFGKTTTTEATIIVSGETTVPHATTARPPSALPEDDPHWRELEGSASGLSLTFAVLFSILRLI